MKTIARVLILLSLIAPFACREKDVAPQTVQVFDLSTKVDGNGFNEIIQAYTRWALGKSIDKTPLNDDDIGTFHAANLQPVKNVTILTSSFGGKTVRSITISGSNYVFLPIYTSTYYYFANDPCYPTYKPAVNQSMEDFLTETVDEDVKGLTNLSAKLNGQAIVPDLKQYHVTSKVFSFDIHKDYTDPNCDYTGQQATAVSDGFYLLIKLPKGKQTITYTADLPAYNFAIDMTWNVTVE